MEYANKKHQIKMNNPIEKKSQSDNNREDANKNLSVNSCVIRNEIDASADGANNVAQKKVMDNYNYPNPVQKRK